eukprot:g1007.t1
MRLHAALLSPNGARVEKRTLFEREIADVIRQRLPARCFTRAARRAAADAEQPIVTRLMSMSDARCCLNAVLKQLSVLFAKELLEAEAFSVSADRDKRGGHAGVWYVLALVSTSTAAGPAPLALVVEETALQRLAKGLLLQACALLRGGGVENAPGEVGGSRDLNGDRQETVLRARADAVTAAAPIYAPAPATVAAGRHAERWSLLQHAAMQYLLQTRGGAISPAPSLAAVGDLSRAGGRCRGGWGCTGMNVVRVQLPIGASRQSSDRVQAPDSSEGAAAAAAASSSAAASTMLPPPACASTLDGARARFALSPRDVQALAAALRSGPGRENDTGTDATERHSQPAAEPMGLAEFESAPFPARPPARPPRLKVALKRDLVPLTVTADSGAGRDRGGGSLASSPGASPRGGGYGFYELSGSDVDVGEGEAEPA